jgi:Uma2 family endonuclease
MIARTGMTAEGLLRYSEPGVRTELVKGELIRMSPSGGPHGKVAAAVADILRAFVRPRRLGIVFGAETGFVLERDPDTVRGADAAFVSNARLPGGELPEGFFPAAPDLAVEVLSPDDRAAEVEEKVAEYLAAGARAVWVLSPRARTLTAHRPGGEARRLGPDETVDGGEALPGFAVKVAEFFD